MVWGWWGREGAIADPAAASRQDLAQVLQAPETLAQYSLIIAVDVNPNLLLPLADVAWEHSIPLIKVRSCGFYGSLRSQIKELTSACPTSDLDKKWRNADDRFTVVETHPESLIDLRIHSPFPSLIEFANTFDYATMDSEQHGHIPAVVILVKALEEWRATVSLPRALRSFHEAHEALRSTMERARSARTSARGSQSSSSADGATRTRRTLTRPSPSSVAPAQSPA